MAWRRTGRDPWWGQEGAAARHDRVRDRAIGGAAFLAALAACGLTAAMWLRELAPALAHIRLG